MRIHGGLRNTHSTQEVVLYGNFFNRRYEARVQQNSVSISTTQSFRGKLFFRQTARLRVQNDSDRKTKYPLPETAMVVWPPNCRNTRFVLPGCILFHSQQRVFAPSYFFVMLAIVLQVTQLLVLLCVLEVIRTGCGFVVCGRGAFCVQPFRLAFPCRSKGYALSVRAERVV